MDEAQEILLSSLENAGVSLPTGLSSIQDLTPSSLLSICSQSLRLIDSSSFSSFPASLPASMPDRFKICSDMASAIKSLGYAPDLSFHQFLYPSDEDSHKLVRFLVERLSQTSEGRQFADVVTRERFMGNEAVCDEWKEGNDNLCVHQSHQTGLPGSSDFVTEEILEHDLLQDRLVQGQTDGLAIAELSDPGSPKSIQKMGTRMDGGINELEESDKATRDKFIGGKSVAQRSVRSITELKQKLASLQEQSGKLRFEFEDLNRQNKMMTEELAEKTQDVKHLEDGQALLKEAVKMAFDDEHPGECYLEELNNQLQVRRNNLVELESQWEAFKQLMEEKKISLHSHRSLHEQKSEGQEGFLQLEKVELETKAIASEISKREEEHAKLSAELEKQPKIASRKSYIHRITEITKNSRKQDSDIERILQETRQLQIESNSIQDRLHRTYAVVDETIFRDAKNDPTRRHAYRLLTSLHESFGQIYDKILATDRVRREATDLEAKLAAMMSGSFDIDKLQADLDAIKKENDLLEQRLQHS